MATHTDESAEVAGEVVDPVEPSALEALVRGEIDVQIATAKRYPRSLEVFTKRAIDMATMDEETAESCIYRRPVGKKKNDRTGKWENEYAEGMSVRMAEIVGACYGNLRVYASLIEQLPQAVRARGMAIDLETNFASSSEVIESTLKTDGTPFSARMRVVVAKAALSKARRDATFQVVPKALARPVESAVRRVLLGDVKTLDKRRQSVLGWITKLGIDQTRVWAALGIEGPADLSAEKLELLTGIRTAIKDNDSTIDEAFPESGGLGVPAAAPRKSQQNGNGQQTGGSAKPPEPPAPGPDQPQVTSAPASAQTGPHVGKIVKVDERPGGTFIELHTGFQCATNNAAYIASAKNLKESGRTVDLTTHAAKVAGKVPVLDEMDLVAEG